LYYNPVGQKNTHFRIFDLQGHHHELKRAWNFSVHYFMENEAMEHLGQDNPGAAPDTLATSL
jgi:hypothetical protein